MSKRARAVTIRITAAALVQMCAGIACAGSLTPPGAPAPTMNTMSELYQKLTNTLAEVQAANQQLANTLAEVQAARLEVQQNLSDLDRRLVLSGGLPSATGDMVLVPAGSFVMGACTNVGHESIANELPQHTVEVSGFLMDKYEVTSNLWVEVYTFATNRGYSFANVGSSKAPGHPIQNVAWYDCLAWCNARSVRDGFTPCYTNTDGTAYTNSSFGRSGDFCNWSANGYRLPTEAEWEKAARGGASNGRYTWSDANTIQHARANYYAVPASYAYDTSLTAGYNPLYKTGTYPYTSPVGSFAPNGYGLYDLVGNVTEWCWDYYGSAYYGVSPQNDPRGPSSGSYRSARGGSYSSYALSSRIAYRFIGYTAGSYGDIIGFRTVRASP